MGPPSYLTLEEATLSFPGLPVQYHLRASQGRTSIPSFVVEYFYRFHVALAGSNLWYQKRHYYRPAIIPEFRRYVDHISKGGSEAEFEAGLESRSCLGVNVSTRIYTCNQEKGRTPITIVVDIQSGKVIRTWMDSENLWQQAELEASYEKRKAR